MKTFLSRRGFLASLSGTALAGSALARGSALAALRQPPATSPAKLTSEMLADGLLLVRGAGANVLVLRDPAGLVFIDGGLKANGKTYSFHRYDGAGHAFFSVDRPMYSLEAAKDGWKQIWSFYGEHLGGR